MTEFLDTIKSYVDDAYNDERYGEAQKAPEVFRDHDQQASPSQLQEWAQYVAAQREFVADVLGDFTHSLDVVDAVLKVSRGDHDDLVSSKLVENAGALIARGFAAKERESHTNVSLMEGRVELRAAEMQRDRLAAAVKQLEHCHREWRSAEFTLDRMIRLAQLRLQMAEI